MESLNNTFTCLGHDRPLALTCAEWIKKSLLEKQSITLDEILILVPTAQSGRWLQAGLLEAMGGAMLSPSIMTPGIFLRKVFSREQEVASPLAEFILWKELLHASDLSSYTHLFPSLPNVLSMTWVDATAKAIIETRHLLGEAGHTIRSAAKLDIFTPEKDRWEDLAKLERAYIQQLEQAGMIDRETMRLESWNQITLPDHIRYIILAACPDLSSITIKILDKIRVSEIPVHVCLSDDHPEGYNEWGKPLIDHERWKTVDIPSFEDHLHVFFDQDELAQKVCEISEKHSRKDSLLIGACDQDSELSIKATADSLEIPLFQPGSLNIDNSAIGSFLSFTRELVNTKNIDALNSFIQHPMGEKHLGIKTAPFLEHLYRLQLHTLIDSIDDLLEQAKRDAGNPTFYDVIKKCHDFIGSFTKSTWPQNFKKILKNLTKDPALENLLKQDGETSALQKILENLDEASSLIHQLSSDPLETFQTFCNFTLIESLDLPPEENALELRGWLELLWNASPHLVLAGFHQGAVPEPMDSPLFLPESAREKLGISSYKQREVRDTTILNTLLKSRPPSHESKRIDILIAKKSSDGSPLFPSQLLLKASEKELGQRLNTILASRPPQATNITRQEPFKLTIPSPVTEKNPLDKKALRVTAFKSFLTCPYQFYLEHMARWKPVDPLQKELNAWQFGNLAHDVLENFGRDTSINQSQNADQITAYLMDQIDRIAANQFGPLTFGIRIQLDSLKQRLRSFASIQAKLATEGWLIYKQEEPIEISMPGGWTITGRVDRIDIHQETGAYRIIDYKTKDSSNGIKKEHISSVRGTVTSDTYLPLSLFSIGEKNYHWKDLQVPLYAIWWSQLHENSLPEIAYFTLPKAVAGTRLDIWDDFDYEWLEAGKNCATSILKAIEENQPLHPLDSPSWKWSPWADWFPHGPYQNFDFKAEPGELAL